MNTLFLFQYKQHAFVLTAAKIEIPFNLYLALCILASRNPGYLPSISAMFIFFTAPAYAFES